jgi:hypothetical protein
MEIGIGDLLQTWTEQILEIPPRDIITKLGCRDILICDRPFSSKIGRGDT